MSTLGQEFQGWASKIFADEQSFLKFQIYLLLSNILCTFVLQIFNI